MTQILLYPPLIALALFALLLLLLDLGWRRGRRAAEAKEDASVGAIDAAVFAILGLLIAFTFSSAASRFEARRAQITVEANAIGTAYLRLDLLPDPARAPLQSIFRRYLDSRILVFQRLPDLAAYTAELDRSNAIQSELWKGVVAASAAVPAPAQQLILPPVNEMIDITTTRAAAVRTHPPAIIFVVLIGLAMLSSLFAGRAMAGAPKRDWPHLIGFAAVMSLTLFVIVDLEFPRFGTIRIDAADHVMLDLRKSMG